MTERTLTELIPGELPPGIAALPPDVQSTLAQEIVDARWRQADELKAAAFSMLDFIPRFLRGPVKKAAGL